MEEKRCRKVAPTAVQDWIGWAVSVGLTSPWCADLQPDHHRPMVSVGSGGLADQRAASDPDLQPGQSAGVANIELEASGGLTV